MIEPSDGKLDVPLAPVRPPGADRRRARTVLVTGLAVAVVGLVLAAISRADDDRVAAVESPRAAAAPSPTPAPSTASTASSSSTASAVPTSRRTEGFQPLPNRPLAGAPAAVLVRRIGDDADLVAWAPGEDALRSVRRFPGAFAGLGEDGLFVTLAPDARSLLILTVAALTNEGGDRARLVTADGGIALDGHAVTALGGVAWSSDSRVIAVGGAPGHWWLVTIDASGDATVRDVTIEPESRASPAPTTLPMVRLVPVGFSEDERWVYGARIDPYRGSLEPVMRVDVVRGTVEAISTLPSSGPDRLDARARGFLDPASGRTVGYRANASIPGGPTIIEVKNPDGTVAFRVEGSVVLSTAWTADGRLLVFDADGVPFPGTMRLRIFDAEGVAESTLVDSGPVAGGWLIGVADGFVALAYTTDRPEKALQLVAVRLADGASSALVVPLTEPILGSGLVP